MFGNFRRVNRAKKIGELEEERRQIIENSYKTQKDYDRLKQISGQIAALKELNNIASEEGNKPKSQTTVKTTYNEVNGVKAEYNGNKNPKTKK